MAQYNKKHAQQNETKLVEGHEVSSKEDLKDRIECYFENINKTPGIFKWKYKMDEVLGVLKHDVVFW